MSNIAAVFLSVFSALGIISNFLILVAVGNLRRDHEAHTDALTTGHNIVARRVSDIADFSLNAAAILAVPSFKSNQGGDAE